jgi:hypothetical protein
MNRSVPPLRTEDVAALARKYRALASLRRDRADGKPIPAREVFRDLADEFPGALRDLDTLPMNVIDARLTLLEACLAGHAERETWMAIEHANHAWLRAALMLKRRLRKRRVVSEEDALRLADEVSARVGVAVDAAFVCEVAAPREGRLRTVVATRVARACGITVEQVRAAVSTAHKRTDSRR